MSAYIVDSELIDALVTAAAAVDRGMTHSSGMSWYWNFDRPGGPERAELHYSDTETATMVGRWLWAENVASVAYRYSDTFELPGPVPMPITEEYIFTRHRNVEPHGILRAISEFEYQSCEHPGWRASEAKAFIDRLTWKMIHWMPEYGTANWRDKEGAARW